jgi:hypothetical protein
MMITKYAFLTNLGTTFVFWDRECNELLRKTASEVHREMVEVGIHKRHYVVLLFN